MIRTNEIINEANDDELFIAFADDIAANAASSSATLAQWAAQYPQHARVMGRMAEAAWSQQSAREAVAVPLSPAEAAFAQNFRAWGREAVRGCAASKAQAAPQPAPLTSLLDAAKAAGLTTQTLAARLRLPAPLVLKLHRRLVAPATIPAALIEQLAGVLNRAQSDISGYLSLPPQLARSASYRSDHAPQVGPQESFADALRRDPDTTAEHRAAWLGGDR